MKCQELDLDSVLPDQEMLMKLMIHPLQIQVCILGFGLAGVPGGSDGKESVCNAGDLIYGFSECYYECTQ